MELPREGGPERAEPGALRRQRRRWDPVSARPVSRGPGTLGGGLGRAPPGGRRARPACRPLYPDPRRALRSGPRDPGVRGGPTVSSSRRILPGPGWA